MRSLGIWLILVLSLSGCSFRWGWVQRFRAQHAIVTKNYPKAIEILQKEVSDNPDSSSALEAARIGAKTAHFDAKNYPAAVSFYREIVLRSPNPDERKEAERAVAQIEFENILDYDQSVIEYEKLLNLDPNPEEKFRFRLNLAKSHFHLNNLDQALHELDVILEEKPDPDEVFETEILKSNVLVSAKKLTEAAASFEKILKEFPDRSKKDGVGLNLVVVYEELKDFGSAIDVLERMRPGYPNPDFLDLRIQRLKERKTNQPGANGLKR